MSEPKICTMCESEEIWEKECEHCDGCGVAGEKGHDCEECAGSGMDWGVYECQDCGEIFY